MAPAATVAFGWPKLPSLASLPPGATKIAAALSPSMPSQLESTKPRSGLSAAPGVQAANAGVLAVRANIAATVSERVSRSGRRCEQEFFMRR